MSDVIADFFVALVPTTVDVNDVEAYAALLKEMELNAELAIIRQYAHPPRAILMQPTEWLVTNSPDEVEAFQPDHDCEECRAGNVAARDFLTANPDRHVVCANLHYTELP